MSNEFGKCPSWRICDDHGVVEHTVSIVKVVKNISFDIFGQGSCLGETQEIVGTWSLDGNKVDVVRQIKISKDVTFDWQNLMVLKLGSVCQASFKYSVTDRRRL